MFNILVNIIAHLYDGDVQLVCQLGLVSKQIKLGTQVTVDLMSYCYLGQ